MRTSIEKARTDLIARIEKGKELISTSVNIGTLEDLEGAESHRKMWDDYNRHLLTRMFDSGKNSAEYLRVIEEVANSHYLNPALITAIGYLRQKIEAGMEILTQLTERLDLYQEPLDASEVYLTKEQASRPARPKTLVSQTHPKPSVSGNRVFIVHGHDEGMKQAVARLVEKLGLEPIILHEQPSAGRTVIEKLEEHSNVEYVIVLLSPDDLGAAKLTPRELRPRPRQNVVFEMGFFVGRLNRRSVCAIVKDEVEIHSDIQGLVYIPMDDKGGWQIYLAKELKKAGFRVSLDDLA